jgi:VIT1/CCC1 family predicted Fe2+/Mn2+ transporter
LAPGSWSEKTLVKIAELADGDARVAIQTLKNAAYHAENENELTIKEKHIEKVPEGEREEVRQIFASKGFKGRELENAVKIITSDREQWVNTMLREELGFSIEGASPAKAAFTTFTAFILIGLLPLVSFLFQLLVPTVEFSPFLASAVLTGVAFFTVGAFKSRFVGGAWYKSGIETLFMGSVCGRRSCIYQYFIR